MCKIANFKVRLMCKIANIEVKFMWKIANFEVKLMWKIALYTLFTNIVWYWYGALIANFEVKWLNWS